MKNLSWMTIKFMVTIMSKSSQPLTGNLRKQLRWRLIGLIGKWFIDGLFLTIRIRYRGLKPVQNMLQSHHFIFAFWHSRIIPVAYTHKGYGGAIMVSRSEDGELIAQVIHRQGHEPIRGSTTRGGREALKLLEKKLMERVRPGVIIPDGPQGPRFKVQHGIIQLAKKTGYPIIPVTGSASRMKIFNSWDRFILPLPFSECLISYGQPIQVPEDADMDEIEQYRQALEKDLFQITQDADAHYGYITE